MQLTWSHAVIYVHDEAIMLDFYTRVLGFEVTDRGPLADNAPDIIFSANALLSIINWRWCRCDKIPTHLTL